MAARAVADAATLDRIRAFNRFYTQRIGALGERLLDGPFSLAGRGSSTSWRTVTRRPPRRSAATSGSTPGI